MNRVYRSRRDLAGQIMRTLGCEYDENQVGMFLWGRIPRLRRERRGNRQQGAIRGKRIPYAGIYLR